jgi:nitrous oxide reductase accessory protein NosL
MRVLRNALVTSTLVLAAWLLAACETESTAAAQQRCELCGMRIESSSGWRAGARAADGEALAFDTPKCLFRRHHERGAVTDPWVIEYYSQARRPARDLFFVIGTDLEGPMGRDLVPVAGRENAERLMREHHGQRVLTFAEVTREVTASLFRR